MAKRAKRESRGSTRGAGGGVFERFFADVTELAGDAVLDGLDQADRVGGELVARAVPVLELADRIDRLGPVGLGVLAWNALPQSARERVTGEVCPQCDAARSLCECCEACGFTPCACAERFTIDAEGVSIG